MEEKLNMDAVELLRQLVAVPSVNPELTRDEAIGGEERLAAWMESWLAARGFATRRIEPTAGRPNVLAWLGPEDAKRTVLFESHLDTVGVDSFEDNPFELRERGSRLYGRGACDTKGPLAAWMAALDDETLAAVQAAGVRLMWLGAMGEETGNYGAEEAVAAGVGADECVVLEPTGMKVVYAHKGACWFRVVTRGRAAHGSDPARGDNAILKMAAVWEAIEAATADAAAKRLLPGGAPTVSLGTIAGGSGVNVVPDRCEIQVDRRYVPGESCEEILADLCQRLAGIPGGVEVGLIKEGRGFHTDPEAGLPVRLRAALAAEGVEPVNEMAAWCSDAGILAETCAQTVVWGPGAIAQAHTTDEFIEREELLTGARVLRNFLLGL